MKEVIDAIIEMLHRKGIVTDAELLDYNQASNMDLGVSGLPRNVINALNRMSNNEE